jgi:hypothetical protein
LGGDLSRWPPHWNGTTWARVPSSCPGLGDLTGVAATSPSNAWAVGFFSSNPARAIALHRQRLGSRHVQHHHRKPALAIHCC